MKHLHKRISATLIIILNFISINSQGQDIDTLTCNIQTLIELRKNIDHASEGLMLKFLKSFKDECKNNVEFSEFSNELLFIVVQKQPVLFYETLQENKEEIDTEAIFFNLENPVNDLIDLELTKQKISNINSSGDIKTKIIVALDKAIDNLK